MKDRLKALAQLVQGTQQRLQLLQKVLLKTRESLTVQQVGPQEQKLLERLTQTDQAIQQLVLQQTKVRQVLLALQECL